jgi:hypothetical protein
MAKKGSKKEKEGSQITLPSVPEHLFVRHPKRWVRVHFKLMGFSALDGEVRLPQTSTIQMVETRIIAHHGGSIRNLSMWRDRIEPGCVIRDFSKTLREIFNFDDSTPRQIPGQKKPQPSVTSPTYPTSFQEEPEDHNVVIFYDYRAHDSDCPLLLRSPRYPKALDQQVQNLLDSTTRKAQQ